ncbi:hypothetical protein DL95DRAFT_399621 [Leptodontidium sp. 2 PMI_412]|nr:hypothetical protein DL95DRAFT_399621 [Leptodontidium sp. 2 PMI_412]
MMTTQITQVLEIMPKALSGISTLGVLNGMRVRISSQTQNSLQRRQNLLIHPAHGMTLKRLVMSTSQLRSLGLVSKSASLLLSHKPNRRLSLNPLHHYRIRPSSKTSTISRRARQWSPRPNPSPSLLTTAMMDGLMIVWLNWRKHWDWLWKSNMWSHRRPARLPPQVLARSKRHRTRPRVENAPKLPVADQKSCKILLDMAQLRILRSGSCRRLRWWKGEA